MKAHPDVVLNSWKEPRKRFVERLNRDFAVHGAVPFYELGEIRVRGETITQFHGFARSAQDPPSVWPLRISKVLAPLGRTP